MTVTLILLSFAAACNAVMDICAHKWHISIFTKYNRQFWDATISWKNKYNQRTVSLGRRKIYKNINLHPAFTDSWHLFKTLMIILISSAIITYQPFVHPLVDLILLGSVWNLTFSLFYKHLLIK